MTNPNLPPSDRPRRPTWSSASQPKSSSRAKFIFPMIVASLLIAGGLSMLKKDRNTTSVSELKREIQSIALTRSTQPGIDNGGPVGPWWIAASHVDGVTGEFEDFRLRSGTRFIAAASARLTVDPSTDTFSFHLTDAVITHVADDSEEGVDPDANLLHHFAQHTLGPAPLGRDIVADASIPTQRVPDMEELLSPPSSSSSVLTKSPDAR